jgi:hypothetical protein
MAVTVIGAHEVAAKFRQAAARVKATQKYMLWDAGQVLQESIATNIMAQGLRKTGQLVGSGRTFGLSGKAINVGFGRGVVNKESGSPYAWALEVGSVPHIIVTKGALESGTAGMLVFPWDQAEDGMFFGPRVMHPGVKPYRFMRHGAEEAMIPIALLVKDWLFDALMIV